MGSVLVTALSVPSCSLLDLSVLSALPPMACLSCLLELIPYLLSLAAPGLCYDYMSSDNFWGRSCLQVLKAAPGVWFCKLSPMLG